MYQKFRKALSRWEMMGKAVPKRGATVREWGILYMAVVQSVLVYGSESWVVMGEILKVKEGLHHWVEKRTMWMTARHTKSKEW